MRGAADAHRHRLRGDRITVAFVAVHESGLALHVGRGCATNWLAIKGVADARPWLKEGTNTMVEVVNFQKKAGLRQETFSISQPTFSRLHIKITKIHQRNQIGALS
jgi:hypothetical protein